MAIEVGLRSVGFGMQALYEQGGTEPASDEDRISNVILSFNDPQSGISFSVLFERPGWEAFKTHIGSDGKVIPQSIIPASADALAKLGQQPSMVVPKGGQ